MFKIQLFVDDIGADMWGYQACSEMVMPFCYDGTNDMFELQKWDLNAFAKDCYKDNFLKQFSSRYVHYHTILFGFKTCSLKGENWPSPLLRFEMKDLCLV